MSRFSDMDAADRIAPMLIRGYHAEYPPSTFGLKRRTDGMRP